MPLATVDDLALVVDTTFDAPEAARAQLMLDLAEAEISAFCTAVSFTQVTDDVVTLKGTYGNELDLPNGPVESVSSVVINDFITVTDWFLARRPDRLVRGVREVVDIFAKAYFGYWGGRDADVAVTYTHGFVTVPSEVRSVCLSLAARKWNVPPGVTQESMNRISAVYDQASMSSDERALLSQYRLSNQSVVMA